jgi:hypothetical protein
MNYSLYAESFLVREIEIEFAQSDQYKQEGGRANQYEKAPIRTRGEVGRLNKDRNLKTLI